MTEPAASMTARLTKFSDAISSRPLFCRFTSLRIAVAISGSVSASVRHSGIVVSVAICVFARLKPSLLPFLFADLIEPALVPPALEFRLQPEIQNLVRIGRAHV